MGGPQSFWQGSSSYGRRGQVIFVLASIAQLLLFLVDSGVFPSCSRWCRNDTGAFSGESGLLGSGVAVINLFMHRYAAV